MTYLRAVWLIARKDLGSESRRFERLSSMLFLSLIILVAFNFAFDFSRWEMADLAAGVLWVTLPLAAILALHDSFRLEREDEGLWALRLAPLDDSAIYLGKLLANLALLLVLAGFTLTLCALFLNFDPSAAGPGLILVVFLNAFGFSALGTLFAALSSRARRGEVLLHLLLLPLSMPLLMSAVRATTPLLLGRGLAEVRSWLQITLLMDVLFATAGVLLFEHLVEE
jgi:heme exporter protein B